MANFAFRYRCLVFHGSKTKSEQMKKIFWILLMAVAANLHADDAAPTNSPATNAPAAKSDATKNDAGRTIPDATHKPVFTTNTVTIAGEPVKYVAETGMLPILKPDGTSRASVFYIAYTRLGETNTSARPGHFLLSTAGPARRPSGCISARSARAG